MKTSVVIETDVFIPAPQPAVLISSSHVIGIFLSVVVCKNCSDVAYRSATLDILQFPPTDSRRAAAAIVPVCR